MSSYGYFQLKLKLQLSFKLHAYLHLFYYYILQAIVLVLVSYCCYIKITQAQRLKTRDRYYLNSSVEKENQNGFQTCIFGNFKEKNWLFFFAFSNFLQLPSSFESLLFSFTFKGFSCGSAGKESSCNAGDLSSIAGLGRSPGERKGDPHRYSGLENSMDCIVHGVTKSQK